MRTPINPFNFETPADRWSFTDREDLLPRIRAVFEQRGRRILFYGRRRMGKTSLIANAARLAKANLLYVDLSKAADLTEAANKLLHALPKAPTSFLEQIMDLATRRLGSVSLSKAGFSIKAELLRKNDAGNLAQVLDFISERADMTDESLTVCLDEFQDIRSLDGERAEWKLRGTIQHHRQLNYLLCGSDHRLLHWMTEPHAAFYKQLEMVKVAPIAPLLLGAWVDERARRGGMADARFGAETVRLAGPCTGDVVRLAKTVFDFHISGRASKGVSAAFDAIALGELNDPFVGQWHPCTPVQRAVLRAISHGRAPQASETLAAYGIRSPGTAQSAIRSLIERQILTRDEDMLVFDNPFFQRWVSANGG